MTWNYFDGWGGVLRDKVAVVSKNQGDVTSVCVCVFENRVVNCTLSKRPSKKSTAHPPRARELKARTDAWCRTGRREMVFVGEGGSWKWRWHRHEQKWVRAREASTIPSGRLLVHSSQVAARKYFLRTVLVHVLLLGSRPTRGPNQIPGITIINQPE